MKAKLSDRVRPNSEVAWWVYDEIVALEQAHHATPKRYDRWTLPDAN